MAYFSFAQAVNRPPYMSVELKSDCGGYTDCQLKLYLWGRGSIIKIEGVNVDAAQGDDIKLVFDNVAEYSCTPCRNGYLFSVFFSDISSENFMKTQLFPGKIFLKSSSGILARNKVLANSKI